MKQLGLFLLLLVGLQCLQAQSRSEEIRHKLINRDTSSVLVVAHRGDWRNFPENSLPAIDHAIKMGVDVVEIDVQRTKDGHFILMHDNSLDRTTTGKGLVSEWTLDSISTLRLRNGCAVATREPVPTLEEALLHAKGKVMLNLDKADRYFDEIYQLLKKTGTTQQIIMKGSKNAEEVRTQFGDYLQDVIYMPIVNLDHPEAASRIGAFVDDLNPVAFELLYNQPANTVPQLMKETLHGQTLIWYNSLWASLCAGHDDDIALEDPDGTYGFLIDTLGARIIQTDRPAFLLDYLRKRNLHP